MMMMMNQMSKHLLKNLIRFSTEATWPLCYGNKISSEERNCELELLVRYLAMSPLLLNQHHYFGGIFVFIGLETGDMTGNSEKESQLVKRAITQHIVLRKNTFHSCSCSLHDI